MPLFCFPQRWDILLRFIPNLTVKILSDTRWESCVEGIKGIRYEAKEIRYALLKVYSQTNDPKLKGEAYFLAVHELENFEFILGVVILYNLLFAVNIVRRSLQSEHIDVASSLEGLIKFIE